MHILNCLKFAGPNIVDSYHNLTLRSAKRTRLVVCVCVHASSIRQDIYYQRVLIHLWVSASLVPWPFPPPFFDLSWYANAERGKAWEVWSRKVMSDSQRTDTWEVVPYKEY